MSKIEITILGTTAGIPTRDRAQPAIHVNYYDEKEFTCLFDCGESAQRQCMIAGINMMRIDDIFISHWHGDHCLGLTGMIDTMDFEGRTEPLRVYAPESRRISKILRFSGSVEKFKVIARKVPSRGTKITRLLETDRLSIVSLPVKHNLPSVCYALIEKDKVSIDLQKARRLGLPEEGKLYKRIKDTGEITVSGRRIKLEDIGTVKKGKKIVYSGDTEICDNLRKIARDADLLIQDCTYFEEQGPDRLYEHAAFPEIAKMVKEENVKRTVLTHISRKYADPEELKNIVKDHPGFEVAEDFMKVVV